MRLVRSGPRFPMFHGSATDGLQKTAVTDRHPGVRASRLHLALRQASRRFRNRASLIGTWGFTLVEVLVAMALTALVVMLLSTAMRSGLMSWRKLGVQSQAEIFAYAVPISLARYLEFSATEATPWKRQSGRPFPMCGAPHGLTFYSTYGPPGSTRQGLRLIGYLYDPSLSVLEVYDVEIIEKEGEEADFLALAQRLLEGRGTVYSPLGHYGDVTEFQISYGEQDPSDASGRKLLWQDAWACEENPQPPRMIRLVFGVRSGSADKVATWVFPVRVP